MTSSRQEPALREAARVGVSRLRLLDRLRESSTELGVQELAELTGLHANTVRFHLDRLVAEGLASRHVQPRTRPGRPRLLFSAVPRPDMARDRRSYRLLAEMLAGFFADGVPDAAGRATQVGRAWGGYLAARPAPYRRSGEEEALAELMRILDEIGFVPERAQTAADHRIRLRHCPFLEVAEAHREVVCSIHLGLMQGVLSELRAPLAAEELRPFAEPSACVATVRRVPHPESGTAPNG